MNDELEMMESSDWFDFNNYKYVNSDGEVEDCRDVKLEYMESLFLYDDDDDFEEFTEGTNRDIARIFKEYRKQIKMSTKLYKKSCKKGDFAAARKAIDNIEDCINKAEHEISILDDDQTFFTTFKGIILNWFLTVFRSLYILIPVVGQFIIIYKNLKDLINEIIQIINDTKSDKLSLGSFNFYKTKIKSYFKEAKSVVKKLRADLKFKEEKYNSKKKISEKEEKAVKESEEYILNKKAIYEACYNGEITIEEREELLANLNDKKFFEETTDYEVVNEEMSNKEKFNRVKKALYERCNSGEIGFEERESLIAKAREMIFEASTDGTDSSVENTAKTKKPENDPDKIAKEVEKNMDKTASDINKNS